MVLPFRSIVVFSIIILIFCGCIPGTYANAGLDQPSEQNEDTGLVTRTPASTITKTTIAPIQTIDPEVKPPVEQPSPSPSPTTASTIPVSQTKTPSPTSTPPVTETPPQTLEESASPESHYQWGLAYENLNQYSEAIAEYDKAISKDPSYANAWYRKGVTLEKMGRYDAAKEAYLVLLAVDPQFSATEESSNLTYLRGNYTGNLTGSEGIYGISLADPAGLSGIILLLFIIGGVVLYLNYHKKKALSGIGSEQGGTADTTSHPPVPGGSTNAEALGTAAIQHYSGNPEVIRAVIAIACQIAAEGREGKPVGTAFIVGDSKAVLKRSRQLILNPVLGHPREELSIANPHMNEYFKELAQLDGAFVISDDGIVEAAGRYISIDTSGVVLPKGLGTRHVSTAAITAVTNALGVVVSESGGGIRIYVDGRDVLENP